MKNKIIMSNKLKSARIIFVVIVALLFIILNNNNYDGKGIIYWKRIFNLDTKPEYRLMNFFDNISEDGLSFNETWNAYLKDLNLLDIKTVDDETVFRSDPIIGTALSSNHFSEFQNLMNSLSKVYNKISAPLVYVYDLGMTTNETEMLMNDYGDIIKEIRKFPFDKYPSYFKKLFGYRWKSIVVADLLKEFPSMWWMDASVQVYKPLSQFNSDIRRCSPNASLCRFYPWQLIGGTSHSIYAATDKRMHKYLPFPEDKSKELTMYGATIQLIFATKEVRENVLRFWVLCSLEEECMDPIGSHLYCSFGKSRYTDYANCNRFDQSAINILLARVNQFNMSRYCRNRDEVIGIVWTAPAGI